mmetsp:Transcript_34542/g.60640  ORF Transcript_34542/g.60640 Transcript_34542/m.60640 type:complete len:167 (-) Transcript_34542:40-540(-)
MNLADLYRGYKSYHQHPINKWIHIFGVPSLMCSVFSYFRRLPIGSDEPSDLLQLHYGIVVYIIALLAYVRLDVLATLLFAVSYAGLYVLGNYLYLVTGPNHIFVCTVIQIVGWGSQFIGHGLIEGNRPALVDNAFQSLLAPLFTTIEVMDLFGYEPEVEKPVKKTS